MDFSFTEEQLMFRQMFTDFVAKELEPLAEHIAEKEQVPAGVLEKAAMQGFLGALLPEEYMGAELDPVSYVLLLEEVARSDMSTALILHIHNSLASRALLLFGSDEQKEHWLPAMTEGSVIGAAQVQPASIAIAPHLWQAIGGVAVDCAISDGHGRLGHVHATTSVFSKSAAAQSCTVAAGDVQSLDGTRRAAQDAIVRFVEQDGRLVVSFHEFIRHDAYHSARPTGMR